MITGERPVASAVYRFVRFLTGGLAPFATGRLVERFNLHAPFELGAVVAGPDMAVPLQER